MTEPNLHTLEEPARQRPVNADYEVLYAGGGIAGVEAAVAAARLGRSVCLLEEGLRARLQPYLPSLR